MNQASMDKSVSASSYVASVSTAIGGYLSLSNIALLIGVLSTVILFFMQWRMYKRRTAQDAEFHAARMKALKNNSL
ncbi:HP1 family phage holin [Vibrio fluvialis]